MNALLFGENHFDAGIDQEQTEEIEDPLEPIDQTDPGKDHETAHNQRPYNAPEQHAMLILGRDAKIAEDERDHKDVVHRQRQFGDVAGDK